MSALITALRGTPLEQVSGLRLALRLAFFALTLPGLPFGLLYLLTRPAPQSGLTVALLAVLALLLGLGTLWAARRTVLDPDLPWEQRGLIAVIQSASAPAAAFFMGFACLSSWWGVLLLWALAAALYAVVWRQIPVWLQGLRR